MFLERNFGHFQNLLPLFDLRKIEITKFLISKFENGLYKGSPVFFGGDFNIFPRDCENCREMFFKSGFHDICSPLFLKDGTKCNGTWIGWLYDKFKKEFKTMDRLDHIFVSDKIKSGKAFVASAESVEQIDKRENLASDHLMIIVPNVCL